MAAVFSVKLVLLIAFSSPAFNGSHPLNLRQTPLLAKFYGRAGLMNLIAAASSDHRQDTFSSLLYEAAGRVINPVDGAVGLLKSGNWARCQAAVDAVLQGSPIAADAKHGCPIHGVDIRHVKKRIRSSVGLGAGLLRRLGRSNQR